MGRLLIWMSGVNKRVLEQCPTERTKFVGVGGAVLTTAIMATVAATLTLSSFLNLSLFIAVPIGLAWGLAIMNLDRWLVASTTRQETVWKNVAVAVPRLLLALIIGLVIAEPLILGVFDNEIREQAVAHKQEDAALQKAEIDRNFEDVDELRKERGELRDSLRDVDARASLRENPEYVDMEKELEELRDEAAVAEEKMICEQEGTCGTQKVGSGPIFTKREARFERLQNDLESAQRDFDNFERRLIKDEKASTAFKRDEARTRLDEIRGELRQRVEDKERADAEYEAASSAPIGLLDRMKALGTLTEENGALNAAHWVLRLFILAIDSLPVLVKMLMALGSASLYDRLQRQYEESLVATAEAESSQRLEATRVSATLLVDEAKARHRVEVEAATELAGEIVAKQKDLARVFIAEWAKTAEEQVKDQARFVNGGVVPPSNGNGNVHTNGNGNVHTNGNGHPSPQTP